MAIGSIINLGGGGGSISGAKGVIICDTSTMTVGDTIRVRDVYDSQNVQNKQVVIVGAPVIFEVEPYCYYKICMVQTIDDTPTEIGGVYSTIDLGQTIYVDMLNKNSLQGIQGILNSHTENYALNIGDEVTIKINDGGTPKDWIMQIGAIDLYDSHEVILVSKYIRDNCYWRQSTAINYSYWCDGSAEDSSRKKCQAFYNSIDISDRQYIKSMIKSCRQTDTTTNWKQFTEYVWIPNYIEVFGYNASFQDGSITKKQFPIFTTQTNRVREDDGAKAWHTCDGYPQSNAYVGCVSATGTSTTETSTGQARNLPCFRLTADS